jgi:hypothetical protein
LADIWEVELEADSLTAQRPTHCKFLSGYGRTAGATTFMRIDRALAPTLYPSENVVELTTKTIP